MKIYRLAKLELEREFKHFRIRIPEGELEEFLADDLKRHNCNTIEDFYASIGYGGTTLSKSFRGSGINTKNFTKKRKSLKNP